MKRLSAPLLCAALALLFMVLHFGWGWEAYRQDALVHGQSFDRREYLVEWGRDTAENLQSEFWQLSVQFLLLAGVLKALGVTVHEEDQARVEEKVDRIAADTRALSDVEVKRVEKTYRERRHR